MLKSNPDLYTEQTESHNLDAKIRIYHEALDSCDLIDEPRPDNGSNKLRRTNRYHVPVLGCRIRVSSFHLISIGFLLANHHREL